MSLYKVVIEIEVEANNPLDAAIKTREITRDCSTELQYYIQSKDGLMYSVDLSKELKDSVLSIMFYNPLIVPNENTE